MTSTNVDGPPASGFAPAKLEASGEWVPATVALLMPPDTSDDTARDALANADAGVLLAVLVHLTGDPSWLDEPYRAMSAGIRRPIPVPPSPELRASIVEAAVEVLRAIREGTHVMPPPPNEAVLLQMLNVVTGDELDRDHLPKLVEDLGLVPRPTWDPVTPRRAGLDVLVVGAGLGGLHVAMQLQRAGIDFRIIEKNSAVGGTWLENTYPECGVDTPNHLYSYSSHLNPDWSRHYARREEILEYIRSCAAAADLLDRVRYGVEVQRASFDPAKHRWNVQVRDPDGVEETLDAAVVVFAVGSLNRPKLPDIPGLDCFEGPAFHTARWRGDVDLTGKRIGIIGNGSSGVQVGRSIAAEAGKLTWFQRTPHWVAPNPDSRKIVDDGLKWAFRHVPYYVEWHRALLYWVVGDQKFANLLVDPEWTGTGISARNEELRQALIQHIRSQVGDRPDLIEKLTPSFPPYTKRMVVDNDWYPTMARPNVELVTDKIERATPAGLVTSDGVHHELDVIVFATGFHNTRFLYPVEIRGRSGRTLAEAAGRDDDVRAYLGVAVPHCPNLFALNGPNSAIGHGGSGFFIAESQTRFIVSCLTQMADADLVEVEVREDVTRAYNERLDGELNRMVWSRNDVTSRYRNEQGRIVATHPWTLQEFWLMTSRADLSEFDVVRRDPNEQFDG